MLSEGTYTGIVYIILSTNLMDMRSLPSINMIVVFAGLFFIFSAGLLSFLQAFIRIYLLVYLEHN